MAELERGAFLKATDAEGVWEFNMVERDIVYEVIPHYQRRRLHAKLAQELEKSLEEAHVATLTTIAYHWNQACMGHEVAEVECSLKAIEFWHRAAEAAYSGSSLMEALKLYQKASQIAETVYESMGGSADGVAKGMARPAATGATSGTAGASEGSALLPPPPGVLENDIMTANDSQTGASVRSDADRDSNDGLLNADGTMSVTDMPAINANTDSSFTAVGGAFKGTLPWHMIGRISRAAWEKSMASCCLGIVLQHRYEVNNQVEVSWAALVGFLVPVFPAESCA